MERITIYHYRPHDIYESTLFIEHINDIEDFFQYVYKDIQLTIDDDSEIDYQNNTLKIDTDNQSMMILNIPEEMAQHFIRILEENGRDNGFDCHCEHGDYEYGNVPECTCPERKEWMRVNLK